MKPTRNAFAAVVAAFLLITFSGCVASPFKEARTELHIEKDGLIVDYASPKDQHVEYDPKTGKVLLNSTTNATLAETAAAAYAQAMAANAAVMQELLKRLPPPPASR